MGFEMSEKIIQNMKNLFKFSLLLRSNELTALLVHIISSKVLSPGFKWIPRATKDPCDLYDCGDLYFKQFHFSVSGGGPNLSKIIFTCIEL
jgi:hypothetical protein